jgi:CheY-like chemotaxis protein
VLAPRAACIDIDRAPTRTLHKRDRDAPALEGALVAVVDDDPRAVDAMSALFETWGARVAGGGTSGEVLDALGRAERYPDLVVADLRLAQGDSGIAVVDRLRNELGLAVPALLVSGDTTPAAERDARTAGLMLLGKPVVPAVLHAAALGLLARA